MNMKINNKEFGKIFLAPMAGVTEVGFRHICKLAGADLTYTEMVSSKALSYDSQKTKDLLITSPIETPKVVQIFGHEPDVMANVCTYEDLSKFDMIDINFGCPAPKIVNNGDGSALLKDLNLVKQILNKCVKASPKPITAKFRKGYFANENIALDMAKLCQDEGVSAITLHGRTKSQGYSGETDLETIANIKSKVKIPVIGNGDVTDLISYNKMLSTGVDAVMIGRGAFGNPNIFRELKGLTPLNLADLVEEHIKMLRQFYNEKFVNVTMRKHLLWYVAGVEGANAIKKQIATCEDINYSLQLVRSLLENK